MSKKLYNVGLIGYQFMGKAHSNAYRQLARFFPELPAQFGMHTLCGRNKEAVTKMKDVYGWSKVETDWRKVVADPEIDIIDIATPGNMHAEIVIAAAKAGKIIFCEKPIGNTLAEAEAMYAAVKEAGVANAVFHNYRKAPAVGLAKQLIDAGKIGRIFHVRCHYLQDWIIDPKFPLVWRLQKEIAGSGSHGDLAAHLIDMARYLVGEFDEVNGLMHTFITERPILAEIDDRMGGKAGDKTGPVTVDDASLFLAKFKNGAVGTFEATRFATGHKNYNRIEINGSNGSIIWNMERMNELEYYSDLDLEGEKGFRLIQATEGSHPYAGRYWPVGHIIGYEHTFVNLLADAITNLAEGNPISPDFNDGYENQRVLDAVEKSHETHSWVRL